MIGLRVRPALAICNNIRYVDFRLNVPVPTQLAYMHAFLVTYDLICSSVVDGRLGCIAGQATTKTIRRSGLIA
jgi:hypothetical protein